MACGDWNGMHTSLGRDNPVSRTYWYSLYACEHYFKIKDNPVLVHPLYNRTRFSTGDQSGDRRDCNMRRFQSIASQFRLRASQFRLRAYKN
jgi:hypothetical protein